MYIDDLIKWREEIYNVVIKKLEEYGCDEAISGGWTEEKDVILRRDKIPIVKLTFRGPKMKLVQEIPYSTSIQIIEKIAKDLPFPVFYDRDEDPTRNYDFAIELLKILRDTWPLIERWLDRKIFCVTIDRYEKQLVIHTIKTSWNDASIGFIRKSYFTYFRFWIVLRDPNWDMRVFTPKELKEAYTSH